MVMDGGDDHVGLDRVALGFDGHPAAADALSACC
jgi:hypothetical protein